jgi:hypothetical protein
MAELGFRGYSGRKSNEPVTDRRSGGHTEDWSRPALFLFLFCAFVIGLFLNSRATDPLRRVRASIVLTLSKPYSASIEGKTIIGDSTIAVFRTRETYKPGAGISETFSAGEHNPPFTSLQLLERVRTAGNIKETRRQDMYGRPSRHFTGSLSPTEGEGTGKKERIYFEYWMDYRDNTAVRLTLSTVIRDVAVSAAGDTLSQATYFNIRYIPQSP